MSARSRFTALFAADILSALGNKVSLVALPWLVLVSTGSPVKMGLVAVAQLVPYLVTGIFATPLADRFGLRVASVVADLGSAVAMAAVAAVPRLGYLPLLGLVAVSGGCRGIGDRAKHVLLGPLAKAAGLGMKRVTAAYAGFTRGSSLVGAPAGGLLILWFGAQGAIGVDAVSFAVCALIVAAGVRAPRELERTEDREPYLAALRGGARYLREDRLLTGMLILLSFANVFGQASWAVFVPVWVSTVLGSPAALGTVLGAFALGGVLGSIAFTALAPKLPQYPTFLVGIAICGAPSLLVLLTHQLAAVLVVMVLVGVASAVLNPIFGALQYERVPLDLQTRVFGLVSTIAYAGSPVGAILGGWALAGLGLDGAILGAVLVSLVVTALPLINYRRGAPAAAREGSATA
jgi:MFS family permease